MLDLARGSVVVLLYDEGAFSQGSWERAPDSWLSPWLPRPYSSIGVEASLLVPTSELGAGLAEGDDDSRLHNHVPYIWDKFTGARDYRSEGHRTFCLW